MPSSCFLAFDLGAESGRALLGTLLGDTLQVREISRFPNGFLNIRGHQHWNLFRLFEEIKNALRLCAGPGGITPASLGIDTWGVDFGLLDRDGNILGLPYAYRDSRTAGAVDSFFRKVSCERVYELTGIQVMALNSLFQLESMVRDRSPLLEAASDLLFMPDLFHYLLTGHKKTEFTFATTSQLFNPISMDWDVELLAALGLPKTLLQPVVMPGTLLGEVSADIAEETGLAAIPVVAVATHDTGSAVAAAPGEGEDWAYISSGTWSLMGVESSRPVITPATMRANFTNEGGVAGTFRFLKNITGLWLVQQCRRTWSLEQNIGYDELAAMAEQAPPFVSLVDPDYSGFANPPDMPAAVRAYCRQTGQPIPENKGAIVRCLLESIALKYRWVLEQLRSIRPLPVRRIHIIGGGSKNRLLCQFTADATGLPVLAGPVEATAIGNLLVQAMSLGSISGLPHLRAVVRNSFPLEKYEPQHPEKWDGAWRRFQEIGPA